VTKRHTPGEWIAVGHWVEHTSENKADICSCNPETIGQGHFNRSDAEICANARLIAAAPDLLEALERVEQDWVNPGDGMPFEDGEMSALDIARAAIAKATGEKA
jgi:hypothetical protein